MTHRLIIALTAVVLTTGSAFAAPPAASPKQETVASKTAKFGSVPRSSKTFSKALNAHALAEAKKLDGKSGAFQGTVTQVYETRSLIALDFDAKYKTALTAVLLPSGYSQFPALKRLKGKLVVITGQFVDFHGVPEIVLADPKQILLVK